MLALFVIPRWTSSGCERTTISRAGGTSQLASWRVSLDRCEIVTGDAVYNHQYGYLNCQKRTTMSSSSIRKHAGNGAASDQPTVPEPSFSERARTLVYLGRIGSVSTLSRKQSGFPFGSVMPYGLDEHGRPIFLISTMAMHTQNLRADSRASLLVTQPDASGDPLGASRVTLMGTVLAIPESGVAEARRLYLERYVNSKYWVDFEDFSFHRMDVVDVYYVGGFGVMGWVSASEYDRSQPDPLADSMAEIIQHMNTDHKDALILPGCLLALSRRRQR